jgi:alcohol dehydrogenase class IV
MEIVFIILIILMLLALAAILATQNKILKVLGNIRIPAPQKIEIPPAKEYALDLTPVTEAIKNIQIKESGGGNINADALQEIAALMRVNQAEFQSSLEAFHKAIDKLLDQIPNGEKELNTQKEFMQKFEDAMRKAQETAAEAMNENSLRLQEILAEVLNKEQKG